MKCEPCGGTGKQRLMLPPPATLGTTYWQWVICPQCGGYGEVSCCEGEVGDGKIANTGEQNE